MRVKNRLSPYPILNDFGDDYIDSSFEVRYEVNTQFTEIYGKLIFELKNDEIKKLIDEKKLFIAFILNVLIHVIERY